MAGVINARIDSFTPMRKPVSSPAKVKRGNGNGKSKLSDYEPCITYQMDIRGVTDVRIVPCESYSPKLTCPDGIARHGKVGKRFVG